MGKRKCSKETCKLFAECEDKEAMQKKQKETK